MGPADIISTAGTVSSSGSAYNGSTSSTASASGGQVVSTSGMSSGFINAEGTSPQAIGTAAGRYYFKITGPLSEVVPLLISGSGSQSASGDGESSVSYSFFQGDSGGVAYSSSCTAGSTVCGDFTYGDRRSLLSGDATTDGMIGSIQIRADFGADNGSGSALIDAVIMIDPSFADAGLYKLTFSDGVTNGGTQGAVPEPTAWAMMVAGFGLVGFAMRRHRQTAPSISCAS
jgi:hypothetical protein